MPVAGGGFEQCYNAQAAVAEAVILVVAIDVVQASNDKQQLEPMLGKIGALPEEPGRGRNAAGRYTGYFSAGNVAACEAAAIEPLIAMGRQPHHPPLAERFADPPPAPKNPTPVEAMAHRLKTPEGRKLYSLRKQIPEPVFGIITIGPRFRQFLLRGLDKVRGEWSLVTMAWKHQADVHPQLRLILPDAGPGCEKNGAGRHGRSQCGRDGHQVPVAVLPTAKSLSAFSLKPQSDRLLGGNLPMLADPIGLMDPARPRIGYGIDPDKIIFTRIKWALFF